MSDAGQFGKLVETTKEELGFCLEHIDSRIPTFGYGENNDPLYSIETIVSALKKVGTDKALDFANELVSLQNNEGCEWVLFKE